ncbi:type II toxin-antitoxin system VapC family toxin [Rhizobium sp. CCGE531]|uniref:type II toxin-antitoxin system VapC family toxin n=1 Tax=Rhizobium sp. CCGE531 TaxID=2364271 RepID=UPI000EA8F138|nr:type II toxin-antitoxin system VapC family toxin [Rhizobium sp. CCGE531]AYG70599.1 type II toxin-antitoxin system VapC family toxin [Rhizobium sp. CCGE531]
MKYLLDTNVLKEIGRPVPHENVAAWLDTVDDTDLAISVTSVREISKGIEKTRKTDDAVANEIAKAADAIFAAYDVRILPVDEAVARRWGQMLGHSDKNIDDKGLAATALANGLVIVTRNVADFQERGVTIMDPFKKATKDSRNIAR